MATPPDTEAAKLISYAEKLLQAAINVLGAAAGIEPKNWARDPKIVALALLCRSVSNFRAAVLLAQHRHVMEARALVRCLYENLLWMGALRERGLAFIEDMMKDEVFNRKTLVELALKFSSKHGDSVEDADSLTCGGWSKSWVSVSRPQRNYTLAKPLLKVRLKPRTSNTCDYRSMLRTAL